MNLNDLEQYGLLAIIPVLLAVIGHAYLKVIPAKDKLIESLQAERLKDAKDDKEMTNQTMVKLSVLIEQIYNVVTRKRGQ